VGEDVVADASHVAPPEELPLRLVVPLLHRHDPHVDAVVAHRLRQDVVELLPADLTETLPARPRLVDRLRRETVGAGDEGKRRTRPKQRPQIAPRHSAGFTGGGGACRAWAKTRPCRRWAQDWGRRPCYCRA